MALATMLQHAAWMARRLLATAASPVPANLEQQLSAAAALLQLVQIPGAGRGLVAAQDIEQGMVVHEEAPMLCSPPPHALGCACYQCLRPLPPAPQMGAARFCSEGCRGSAERVWWAAGREAELAPLRQACSDAGEKMPLMLARLACLRIQREAEAAAAPPKQGHGSSTSGGSIDQRTEHGGEKQQQQQQQQQQRQHQQQQAAPRGDPLVDLQHLCFARIAEPPPEWVQTHGLLLRGLQPLHRSSSLGRGLGEGPWAEWLGQAFSLEWYVGALARLHLNVFRVDTVPLLDFADPGALLRAASASVGGCSTALLGAPPTAPQGAAIYALASMFNHSCEPCVDVTFPENSALAAFTAARDIAVGEQLCISYIDAGMPFEARQQALQWAYGFVCSCPRCQEEG